MSTNSLAVLAAACVVLGACRGPTAGGRGSLDPTEPPELMGRLDELSFLVGFWSVEARVFEADGTLLSDRSDERMRVRPHLGGRWLMLTNAWADPEDEDQRSMWLFAYDETEARFVAHFFESSSVDTFAITGDLVWERLVLSGEFDVDGQLFGVRTQLERLSADTVEVRHEVNLGEGWFLRAEEVWTRLAVDGA